jgi:PhnB protein
MQHRPARPVSACRFPRLPFVASMKPLFFRFTLARKRAARGEVDMPHPIPYLSFNGNCAQAMRFYERALGGKIEMLMRGADSPMAAQTPPQFAERIVHARLALPGGGMLYAGDCPPQMPYSGIHGIGITLNYETVDEATKTFGALADGGKVTMALAPSFWAKMFGMVTDQFGTSWVINAGLHEYFSR